MKLFNGQETIVVEKDENTLKVFLQGSQVKTKKFDSFNLGASLIPNPNEIYTLELDYQIPEHSISLVEAIEDTQNRTQRLQLAGKLSLLSYQEIDYHLSFLHPENIYLDGDTPKVVHHGVLGKISPVSLDEEQVLTQYKALIVSTVNPKLEYEKAVSMQLSVKDKFASKVLACEDAAAVNKCLAQEVIKENEEINKGKAYVSKGWHRFFIAFSALALVALIVAGLFLYNGYAKAMPKQQDIIAAQSDFLIDNYSKTLDDLQKYTPNQLPNSAKYVLAVSSVQLSSLTASQKQAVMNNLSIKSDDNTLNYWIFTGRGDFDKALNLAKNLGDNTLTYLAYYNLYESTKLNSTMSGAKKQSLLDSYSKEIDKLGKTLGLNK